MIKHIIWDLDGTLFDTYPSFTNCFLLALNDFGYQIPYEKVFSFAQVTLDYCIQNICEAFDLDKGEYTDHFMVYYAQVQPETQPPYEGVSEVCEWIQSKGGMNFIVTHRMKRGALELLHYYDMAHLFTENVYADDGYPSKPDPTAFDYLINKYGLDRDLTLGIGDRDLDVGAGINAGIKTCFFANGTKNIPNQPDLTIHDFQKLIPLLRE